jgi:hypothetical protein
VAVHEDRRPGRRDLDLSRSSAEVDGQTGLHFANSKPTKSSKASYDTAAAGRLWQVSADLVGLSTSSRV